VKQRCLAGPLPRLEAICHAHSGADNSLRLTRRADSPRVADDKPGGIAPDAIVDNRRCLPALACGTTGRRVMGNPPNRASSSVIAVTTSGFGSRLAILAPMRSELRPLVRLLSLRAPRSGDRRLLECSLGPIQVVATTTGIGTRAAARTVERLLGSTPIHHVVVVGIAGGIGPSVDIGDLVVPELVIELSTGAKYRPTAIGDTEARGTLATSDELLIDPAEAARLESEGVIAVDMETAAIAAVCESRRCPWSVFRAISDRAGDGSIDQAVVALAGPDGEPNVPALMRFVLTNPKRVPELARLGRGLRLATHVAASAAVRAIRTMSAT